MKLKKGDKIIIIKGKDKGRQGKIEKAYPKKDRVLVPGLNIYKRHLKAQGKDKPGGILDFARPLPVANVVLVCPKCKKPTRVGYRVNQKGSKHRICKKCQEYLK